MGRRKKVIFTEPATLPLDGGGCAPVLDAPPPLDRFVSATFERVPVTVTAIGAKRVMVKHDRRLAPEGDLTLSIPGLFPELSRVGGRVVRRSKHESVIEITRNPVYLNFAVEALREPPVLHIKKQPVDDIEDELMMLPPPPDRDVPSLIPIVRLRAHDDAPKPASLLHRLAARLGLSR